MRNIGLILVASFILTLGACANQIKTVQAPTTAETSGLTADENGFREIKWLAAVEELEGMILVDDSQPVKLYRRKNEVLVLEGEKPTVYYGFHLNQFCAAAVTYNKSQIGLRILEIVAQAYGPADRSGPDATGNIVYQWDDLFLDISFSLADQGKLQYRYKPVFNQLEPASAPRSK